MFVFRPVGMQCRQLASVAAVHNVCVLCTCVAVITADYQSPFAPQIFPDPEYLSQPQQSGEMLIPAAQPRSENIVENEDNELLVVPTDDGHLSGRKSVVEVSP